MAITTRVKETLLEVAETALQDGFVNSCIKTDRPHVVDFIPNGTTVLAYLDCKESEYMHTLTVEEQCLFILFLIEYIND